MTLKFENDVVGSLINHDLEETIYNNYIHDLYNYICRQFKYFQFSPPPHPRNLDSSSIEKTIYHNERMGLYLPQIDWQ